MKKNLGAAIMLVLFFAVGSGFAVYQMYSSFSNSDNAGKVIAILAPDSLIIGENGTALPKFRLQYDDGREDIVSADSFWFVGVNSYMIKNKIYPKPDAPFIYEDEMQVIYRNNTDIKTTLNIIKKYVPLESIILGTRNNEFSCEQGESLQFLPDFSPADATDKSLVYEIVHGNEFAAINNNGLLTINELAAVNEQVQIKATAKHSFLPQDVIDDADESNIITITIKKSYNVISVDETTESVSVPIDKNGFVFWGYYTDKNGTGIKYFDYKGNAVNKINTELKLYAYWVTITTGRIYQYNGTSIRSDENNGHQHTNYTDIGLDFVKLKEIGYTKVEVIMDLELRAQDTGNGREIWLDLSAPTNGRVWEADNVNVSNKSWNEIENGDNKYYYTITLDIDGFDNNTQYRYGFATKSYFLTGAVWYYNESYTTFTAVK
jgi:hypothetical protein